MSETDDSDDDVDILSKERKSTKDLVVEEPTENVINGGAVKLCNITKSLNNLALSPECALDGCADWKKQIYVGMLEMQKTDTSRLH